MKEWRNWSDTTKVLATDTATAEKLELSIRYEEIFSATVNSPSAVARVEKACAGRAVTVLEQPFRWSEDFGQFTQIAAGAFFGIGAGTDMPQLHNADYDFPDDLIEKGSRVFLGIIDECLNGAT